MSFRLHKWHTFAAGFAGGLFVFAVGREVWRAFASRPAGIVVSEALTAIGSLRWIDTTLITGLAAVAAAFVSVRAVRAQMQQTADIETDRKEAKAAAARAVLPLALSAISDYAMSCARLSHGLLLCCTDNYLPSEHEILERYEPPIDAINVIKEMVEYLSPENRMIFAKLAAQIQILNARLSSLYYRGPESSPANKITLLIYTVDALVLYAMCSVLFDFARFKPQAVPREADFNDISQEVSHFAIFSPFKDDLMAVITP